MIRAKPATAGVILEVTPSVAKLLQGSRAPLQAQRLHAHALTEPTEEPTAALRGLLASTTLGVRQVGLVFGRETLSLRALELPSTEPKELSSMLELQLGKLTPYPRAEIIFAWTTMGSLREGYTSVLLAITRKALVDSVLELLKSKGVSPLWIGVSTEGLEAWWALAGAASQDPGADAMVALIDVDATATDCALLRNGRLQFTHHVPIGAEQIAASQQGQLRWMGELVRLPRILQHEEVRGQIGRGVVTGLTQGLQPLVEQLASQWGVRVELADALKPCALTQAARQAAVAGRVSYTALVGLLASAALPRIDLMPPETRVSQALGARARHLSRLAGSLLVMLVLVVCLYVERIMILQRYRARLHQRLAAVEETAQRVAQRKQAMEQVRAWLDPSQGALEALQAITTAAGSDVAVTQVSYDEGGLMKIRGSADAVQAPYEFADRLKQQPAAVTRAGCYVANTKSTGTRGAEFEVVCGKSAS